MWKNVFKNVSINDILPCLLEGCDVFNLSFIHSVLQNYRYSFIDLFSSVLQIFMEKSEIFCLESGNPVNCVISNRLK